MGSNDLSSLSMRRLMHAALKQQLGYGPFMHDTFYGKLKWALSAQLHGNLSEAIYSELAA